MDKQERIEFVEKCLRLALAISQRSEDEYMGVSLYKDGEVSVDFGFRDCGEWIESCVELSEEDLNCLNTDEIIAKRETEKQQRIKDAKEAEARNLVEYLARAAETEYKQYLGLKSKYDKLS